MASERDIVLQVEDLGKAFPPIWAVRELSFQVHRGEIVGLLGANGAGKTTTIAMILDLITPTTGRIRIFGKDLSHHRSEILSRMNFSSPYVDLPHRLTVHQNLLVYARLYGLRHPQRKIHSLAEQLQLGPFLDHQYGQLSSGQRTRVALAKALINDPDLLLLDEPTASLDPDIADRVRTFLLEYCRRRGTAILFSSHNMSEVERICDRVLILKWGRLVAQGPPRELLERYGRDTLEEVFLAIERKEEAPE